MQAADLIKLPTWVQNYLTRHEVFRVATQGFSEPLLYSLATLQPDQYNEPRPEWRRAADERLIAMPQVTEEFLETGQRHILPAINGNHRIQLQVELIYLRSLRALQAQALQRTIERQDAEFQELLNSFSRV